MQSDVQNPLGLGLGLILSSVLSWLKLIGWHLSGWGTGQEKSVGEMSFIPAEDTCDTICDSHGQCMAKLSLARRGSV